jgi:hypothetical protein
MRHHMPFFALLITLAAAPVAAQHAASPPAPAHVDGGTPSSAPGPGKVTAKAPEKAPEKAPAKASEKAPEKAPDKTPVKAAAKAPEKAPENVPDKAPVTPPPPAAPAGAIASPHGTPASAARVVEVLTRIRKIIADNEAAVAPGAGDDPGDDAQPVARPAAPRRARPLRPERPRIHLDWRLSLEWEEGPTALAPAATRLLSGSHPLEAALSVPPDAASW